MQYGPDIDGEIRSASSGGRTPSASRSVSRSPSDGSLLRNSGSRTPTSITDTFFDPAASTSGQTAESDTCNQILLSAFMQHKKRKG